MRAGAIFLTTVVAGVAVANAAAAAAADVCVEDKAKQALSCSGAGKTFDAATLKTGPSFHPVAPPAKATSTLKAPAPSGEPPPRDDRSLRLVARQKELLVIEVSKVESLLAVTKQNAADRQQILRRLADDYVELESAAFRDKTEAEVRRDAIKNKDAKKAGQEQTNANDADRTMKQARKRAIQLYGMLANDYPNSPKLDEVLYYLAYEHEQANDLRSARATYYDLIKKAPTSRYIPNAYLAFGELFWNEAQGDPSKWDLAAQAYAEVIKYPAPQNKVQGYALYKTAYVYWNKGEFDRALDYFKKTIDFGVANPSLPGATKLADSARRDLIPVYALKGDPKMAYAFLHGVAGDPPGANDKTYRMMDDLGNAYLDTGHYPEGIVVYKDLISRDRGGRTCGYQARITEAVMAMRSADKDAIKSELDGLLKIAEASKTSGADKEAKLMCGNRTAALVTETAMAWHLEAIGSQSQRGTGDKKTMTLAAYLYKRAIDTFTAKDFAAFEFPRLIKEDWPTSFKIKYAMADLLYSQKDWAKCGPAFDAVVAEDPNGPEAAKSAYAAGLCYQGAYEEGHKGNVGRRGIGQLPSSSVSQGASAPLQPKEMAPEQVAMVRAFDRYVCTIKPAANDAAAQEQLVEVKYARARTYFEAQHWEEAAVAFRDIAMNHPTHDSGTYAAQLYLESANVLNRHFGKPSCEEDMSSDVPRFLELYCGPDKAQKNADHCATFRGVQVDLARLSAQRKVERADKTSGKEAIDLYTEGGTKYFELFRTNCQDPVAAGGKPQVERCDEIAYNAAKAFQAARLLAKAITVRRALLAFDERTRLNSVLTKKASYEIGANYQAIAVYDQAAEWFEKYAHNDPRAENADKALSDAVLLRLGLGQEQEAIKDADELLRNYGASKPALAGAVAYAIGAHHAEKEEWEKARVALSGVSARGVIDRAPPDIQLQAHATLGRALSHLGSSHAAQARAEYAKVKALWADPTASAVKIRGSYPGEDDAQKERRVGRAIASVGEAFFFFAEERKVAEVDSLKFPEYKGPGDKASVKLHVDTKVKDWYTKKMAAIVKVEAEYAKVLDLKPQPPPKWVIAAGSRSGLMWGDFVDDFRRAPIPKAWRGTDIEQVYTTAIDLASEPYKRDHAKPALTNCLALSTKYQYFDAFSRDCEVWLAKSYKQEYHVVDELRGAPTLANSGLSEKAPPVLSNGVFFRAVPATSDAPAEKTEKNAKDETSTATPPAATVPRARRR